jgi:aspartate dehydrogenase
MAVSLHGVEQQAIRRLGMIGCGAIGEPVIRAVQRGAAGRWRIAGVLARRARTCQSIEILDQSERFFAQRYDLIVETAGPGALRAHGLRALEFADLWSVSGAVLADDRWAEAARQAACRTGHRLRLVSAAIAGLDGVAAAACDPGVTLLVCIREPTGEAGRTFIGTAREAARLYPDFVNVAVAAAIAGPGLDATRVELSFVGSDEQRLVTVQVRSSFGQWSARVEPVVDRAGLIHPVAASLVANLVRESLPIWAG